MITRTVTVSVDRAKIRALSRGLGLMDETGLFTEDEIETMGDALVDVTRPFALEFP